jgi:hypothetical protein
LENTTTTHKYTTTDNMDFHATEVGSITGQAVYVGTTGVTKGAEPQDKITVEPIDLWTIKDAANEMIIGKTFDLKAEKLYLFIKQSYGFSLPADGTVINLTLKRGNIRQDYKTKENRNADYLDNYWLNIDKKFDIAVSGQTTLPTDTPSIPNMVDAKNVQDEPKIADSIFADDEKLVERLWKALNPFSPHYNRQASILWQVGVKETNLKIRDDEKLEPTSELYVHEFKRLCGWDFGINLLEKETGKLRQQVIEDDWTTPE